MKKPRGMCYTGYLVGRMDVPVSNDHDVEAKIEHAPTHIHTNVHKSYRAYLPT